MHQIVRDPPAAAEALISEGINVNVTLLFALGAYERAADAYIAGLEKLIARGSDPTRVASVASFFISRIDTAIDALIATRLQASTNAREQSLLRGLSGRVATANAKLAYQRYEELFTGPRWRALAAPGAPGRSACCGQAPARRTPHTGTSCTSRS